MKVDFNPKTGLPSFSLEEKDLKDAEKIKAMMETEGWKLLTEYWEVGRENILDAGMDGIRTRAKRDLSDLKWAILKGFTECSKIADRVVARAEEFNKDKEKETDETEDTGSE